MTGIGEFWRPLDVWLLHSSLMAETYPRTVLYMWRRPELSSYSASPSLSSLASSSPAIHSAPLFFRLFFCRCAFTFGHSTPLRNEASSSSWGTVGELLPNGEEELAPINHITGQVLAAFWSGILGTPGLDGHLASARRIGRIWGT